MTGTIFNCVKCSKEVHNKWILFSYPEQKKNGFNLHGWGNLNERPPG